VCPSRSGSCDRVPSLHCRLAGLEEVIINIAVLVSGSGTNLQALIDTPDLRAGIGVVVSDRPGVEALARAERAGLPARVVPWADSGSREQFSEAIRGVVESHGAEVIVLAGFMRVLTGELVGRFSNRILNIHPSLLPSFPGSNAVAQALEHGVKVTGVTVHFVDEEVDHGPIIAQRAVPVLPDDDRESLHRRIQVVEHELYPLVVSAFSAGEISVEGTTVKWL
jgi:phosphoribosylglycinamide formyltransferase-1